MPEFKYVCLFLFITTVDEYGEKQTHAVLQRRGRWDLEKGFVNGRPVQESWEGGCQGLATGKLKAGEHPIDGIHRESREELGSVFHDLILSNDSLHQIHCYEDNMAGTFFLSTCSKEVSWLREIRFHESTGGLEFVTFEELDEVENLLDYPKDMTVPNEVIAMFPDQLEALRKLWPED